jgi:two-component system phosphate regulon sensor histidine kinase PhoR
VNSTIQVNDRTLDVLVVVLQNEDASAAAGAIVVLQDVTEMLRLEQVRSDFVANASHELKTPIAAIRGFSETILDDDDMTEAVRLRFVGRIRSQATRLDNIVQDLIHLSRFDAYAVKMQVGKIDLSSILGEVFQAKLEDAADAGIDFKIELPPEAVEVQGELTALEQMVANLVDNAFKYSGAEGTVVLRLGCTGQMAVIEVEDNGIGIAEDEQQRIFERFYRVDRGRSREQGGTGLGLAIVKHIALSHNGSVSVTSKLEKGSTFCVNIPLVSVAQRQTPTI